MEQVCIRDLVPRCVAPTPRSYTSASRYPTGCRWLPRHSSVLMGRSITSKGRSDAGSPVQVNAADLASAFNAQALASRSRRSTPSARTGRARYTCPSCCSQSPLLSPSKPITREWWKNNTVTDVLIKHRKQRQTEHGPPDKKPGSQQEGVDPVAVQVGYRCAGRTRSCCRTSSSVLAADACTSSSSPKAPLTACPACRQLRPVAQ